MFHKRKNPKNASLVPKLPCLCETSCQRWLTCIHGFWSTAISWKIRVSRKNQKKGFCSNFLILGHSHLREGGEVATDESEPGFQVSHMCRVRPVGKTKLNRKGIFLWFFVAMLSCTVLSDLYWHISPSYCNSYVVRSFAYDARIGLLVFVFDWKHIYKQVDKLVKLSTERIN